MNNDESLHFHLYEVYLSTAEKVSDRRAGANSWMLSVNTAITGLYGYLQADKLTVSITQKATWLLAIPAAGTIVCLAWCLLLTSYAKLNRAKFRVLAELEVEFPVRPFTREHAIYHEDKRKPLFLFEILIPGCFAALYVAILFTTILS